jgi:hypothetical protein
VGQQHGGGDVEQRASGDEKSDDISRIQVRLALQRLVRRDPGLDAMVLSFVFVVTATSVISCPPSPLTDS